MKRHWLELLATNDNELDLDTRRPKHFRQWEGQRHIAPF